MRFKTLDPYRAQSKQEIANRNALHRGLHDQHHSPLHRAGGVVKRAGDAATDEPRRERISRFPDQASVMTVPHSVNHRQDVRRLVGAHDRRHTVTRRIAHKLTSA